MNWDCGVVATSCRELNRRKSDPTQRDTFGELATALLSHVCSRGSTFQCMTPKSS